MVKISINNYGDLEWMVHFWLRSENNWQLFKRTGKVCFTGVSPFQEGLEQAYNALTELKAIFDICIKEGKIHVREFNKGTNQRWTVSQKNLDKYYEIVVDKSKWEKQYEHSLNKEEI